MSKYIAAIPRAAILRAALVEAGGRSMDQVKAACGCSHIINSWFYDMTTGKAVGNLKISGAVKADAGWDGWGLTWDKGPDIRLDIVPDNGGASYLSGVELLTPTRGPDDALSYAREYGGSRGRSAVLLAGEMVVLYCSGDGTRDARTPEGLRDELVSIGKQYAAEDDLRALGLDSGGSSQCDLGGQVIHSARRVAGYLCIWTKEDEKVDEHHKVCLDPGHGPGNGNGSPDGTYREHEFTWDMARRVKDLLEGQGVGVVLTRTADGYPSLSERADISNREEPGCFLSLHSNAAGMGGWSSASGLEVYTSQGPMTAARNVLASKLVNAFHAAGVALRSEPIKHELYTVLVKTDAPAVLIEYGYHTDRDEVERLKDGKYRDELAQATAKGVCDFLGVAWQAGQEPEDAPDGWAAEAWQKARDKGVLDGTRPRGAMTRQELAVVLDRLGLLG